MRNTYKVLTIVCIAIMFILLGIVLYIQYQPENIDKTASRMLVTYWELYVPMILSGLLAQVFSTLYRKEL